ncbi:MAG: hypothetical protein M3437_13635, partial [Chloroflexota bacterium]|nr:hypothetical protein [Chloroflexota bacterium]
TETWDDHRRSLGDLLGFGLPPALATSSGRPGSTAARTPKLTWAFKGSCALESGNPDRWHPVPGAEAGTAIPGHPGCPVHRCGLAAVRVLATRWRLEATEGYVNHGTPLGQCYVLVIALRALQDSAGINTPSDRPDRHTKRKELYEYLLAAYHGDSCLLESRRMHAVWQY